MEEKEWHKDRIEELKFLRQRPYDTIKIIITGIISFGALTMAMVGIYFIEREQFAVLMLI